MVPEPFKYGKPVTDRYFVNREKELEKLCDMALAVKKGSEVNIALVGLRRTGKTSLLKNLEDKLSQEHDIVPVFLDCYGIPSKNTFSKLFIEAVKDSYVTKLRDVGYKEKIATLLKKRTSDILSKISNVDVSIAHYLSVKIGFREGAYEGLWERLLEYPEKLGAEKDIYFVVMLDEFPDIAMRWGQDLIKRFRAVVQHQTRVMYVLSGSAVTYLGEFVHNKSSPFYRQLKIVSVEELPAEIVGDFVKARLDIEKDVLKEYVKLTGCFPDYMQRLGHILVYKFGAQKVKVDMLREAYEDMLYELDAEFKETLNRLNQKSGVYGDILLALPAHERISELARALGVSQSSLPKYLRYLIQIGIVKKNGKGLYALTDPVFESWVREMCGGRDLYIPYQGAATSF